MTARKRWHGAAIKYLLSCQDKHKEQEEAQAWPKTTNASHKSANPSGQLTGQTFKSAHKFSVHTDLAAMLIYTAGKQALQPTLCNFSSCRYTYCTKPYPRQGQKLHRGKSHTTLPEAISTAARLHLRGTAEVRLWSCLMACCRCTCVAKAACPMRDTAPRAMRGPSLPCIPSAKTRRRNSREPALFAESAMPAVMSMITITQGISCFLFLTCLTYGVFVNQMARA